MTVEEIIEQVKLLSPQEREDLSQQLQALNQASWTEEELNNMFNIQPMTGREIVEAGLTGGWKDMDVEDGASWVENRRHAKREARKW